MIHIMKNETGDELNVYTDKSRNDIDDYFDKLNEKKDKDKDDEYKDDNSQVFKSGESVTKQLNERND